ncbi:13925_t:CDS:1, partial [Entrophospora sp. SA101]
SYLLQEFKEHKVISFQGHMMYEFIGSIFIHLIHQNPSLKTSAVINNMGSILAK